MRGASQDDLPLETGCFLAAGAGILDCLGVTEGFSLTTLSVFCVATCDLALCEAGVLGLLATFVRGELLCDLGNLVFVLLEVSCCDSLRGALLAGASFPAGAVNSAGVLTAPESFLFP